MALKMRTNKSFGRQVRFARITKELIHSSNSKQDALFQYLKNSSEGKALEGIINGPIMDALMIHNLKDSATEVLFIKPCVR